MRIFDNTPDYTNELGLKPITVVRIWWDYNQSKIGYYSDSYINDTIGHIVSISGLETVAPLDTALGQLNITLDDTDGKIKEILDEYDVHKRKVFVYFTYQDLLSSDFNEDSNASLLFTGEISSPIQWNEANRTVSLTVISAIEDAQVGISAESLNLQCIRNNEYDKMWPMVYGHVAHVPAVHVSTRPIATSLTEFSFITRKEIEDFEQVVVDYIKATRSYNRFLSSVNDDTLNQERVQKVFLEKLEDYTDAQQSYIEAVIDLRRQVETESVINNYISALEARTNYQLDIAEKTAQYANLHKKLLPNLDVSEVTSAAQLRDGGGKGDLFLERAQHSTGPDYNRIHDYILQVAEEYINVYTELQTLKASLATHYDSVEYPALKAIYQDFPTPINLDLPPDFPTGQIILVINGLKLLGNLNTDGEFTIDSEDAFHPLYTNLSLSNHGGGYNTLKLSTFTDVRNYYCLLRKDTQRYIVQIVDQDDTMCTFRHMLFKKESGTDKLVPLTVGTDFVIEEVSPIILPDWLDHFSYDIGQMLKTPMETGYDLIGYDDFSIKYGDKFYYHLDSNGVREPFEDTWVANCKLTSGSDTVKEVCAYRDYKGSTRLMKVPESYYTVTNYSFGDYYLTLIRFKRPLTDYFHEHWEDGNIFVSLVSNTTRNAVSIMEQLINNYTSFALADNAAAQSYVDDYPCNFALTSKRNAIQLVKDIAWQARCAVLVDNNSLKIKYLPYFAEQSTIGEADIEADTLNLTLSGTEDLVTEFKAVWRKDSLSQDNVITYRNNIPKYGKTSREFNFWIYNDYESVSVAATFWLIQYSNTWKILEFDAFLNKLPIQTYDNITLNLSEGLVTASGNASGIVEQMIYDPENFKTRFKIKLGVMSGTMDAHPLAYPHGLATAYPTAFDNYAGLQSKVFPATSGSVDSIIPLLGSVKDVGNSTPGLVPTIVNPVNNRTEQTKITKKPKNKKKTRNVIDLNRTDVYDEVNGLSAPLSTLLRVGMGPITDETYQNVVVALDKFVNIMGPKIDTTSPTGMKDVVIPCNIGFELFSGMWEPYGTPFWAKITGNSEMDYNRWFEYSWEKCGILLDDGLDTLETQTTFDNYELINDSSTNQSAYNLCELKQASTSGSTVFGNGVTYAYNSEEGAWVVPETKMKHKPIPSNTIVLMKPTKVVSDDPTEVDTIRYFFYAVNGTDGVC